MSRVYCDQTDVFFKLFFKSKFVKAPIISDFMLKVFQFALFNVLSRNAGIIAIVNSNDDNLVNFLVLTYEIKNTKQRKA